MLRMAGVPFPGKGRVPANTFVTIRQVVLNDRMGIYVNDVKRGELAGDFSKAKDPIVEGEGWRGFKVGAKREDLIKELGKPDADPNGKWLQWKKKYAIHCMIDDVRGATELRFDSDFKGQTAAGIGIGSSLKQAFAAYGELSAQKDNGNIKQLTWESKGILVLERNAFAFRPAREAAPLHARRTLLFPVAHQPRKTRGERWRVVGYQQHEGVQSGSGPEG